MFNDVIIQLNGRGFVYKKYRGKEFFIPLKINKYLVVEYLRQYTN